MAYNPVNIAAAAGTQTASSGTVVFSNSNSITFGMSNSSVVTASFAQSNQQMSVYATGNTLATNSTSMTVNASSLDIAGSGIVSVGASNGSIVVSASAAQSNQSLGLYATGNTASSSSTTIDARSVSYDALGAATMGFSNSSIQVSVPNTSSLSATGIVSISTNAQTISIGASQSNQQMSVYATGNTLATNSTSMTVNASSLDIAGSGIVSVGASNGSIVVSASAAQSNQQMSVYATGNTIATNSTSMTVNASSLDFAGSGIASVGASGGSVVVSAGVATLSRLISPTDQLTGVSAFGNGSLSIQYVPIDEYVTATRLDVLASWSAGTAGPANANTMAIAMTAIAGIYTRNASTLSSVSTGSTRTTYSYASNTGNYVSINSMMLPVSVPMNMNIAPGEYYVAFGFSTNSSSIGTATTNVGQTVSIYGGTVIQTALNYAEWLAGTATSKNLYSGQGMYTATATAIPSTIGLAAINQTGVNILQANMALVFRNY